MVVKDGFKVRVVQCPKVFHRVGCHAIMVPFEKYTYPTLITNTAASIKGRGMHWLHQIVEEDILADPENMKMYYQCDIFHYYDSISQELMMAQTRQYTSDPVLLPMMYNFITLLKQGLSKGLRSSQCLANLHLSDIDHKMCQQVKYHQIEDPDNGIGTGVVVCGIGERRINGKKIRYHYYRYCDDIVICAASAKELWLLRDYLVSLLDELGLSIKPTEAVRPMLCGLDYLGYNTFLTESTEDDGEITYDTYSRIRKRSKQKFCRRIAKVQSRKRRQKLIGSFFGMAAHADCRHLLKKIITPNEFRKLKHKRKMEDIGNFDLPPVNLNGKKNFRGVKKYPRDFDRQGVIIVDYEYLPPKREVEKYEALVKAAEIRGERTDRIPLPKEKYLVQIIHNKLLCKMWTGDKEFGTRLEQMEEIGQMPFFAAIEMNYDSQYPVPRLVSAQKYGFVRPSDEELAALEKGLGVKLLKPKQ
ncbi:hypothetical protein [uncultured Duncaniella sp.]|uniref:hypothetical protein n=1 Tax=uncultured Duncaniella sp. TaxID=2768039 RepID=UPI0026743F84|nr:hypothetical protein [uncultured Duncaniella sp.]